MMDPDARTATRQPSQDTLISLMQLDPSPIETPPADADPMVQSFGYELESSASTVRPGSTTSAPGLGSSGQGSIYYLTRIQRYSSYAFGIFSTLHLTTTSLLPAITRSVPASETYLLMTREIYQTPLTEPLLVALPLIAHVGSGIALRLIRRNQNMKRYGGGATPGMYAVHHSNKKGGDVLPRWSPWPIVSWISLSGYALTAAVAAHIGLNRVLPVVVDGDSSNIGLAFIAHGFARHPVVSWLSYAALIGSFSGHAVWGAAKYLGLSQATDSWYGKKELVDKTTRRSRRRKWMITQGVVAGVAALWAVGGLGVVARGGSSIGWVGKLYDGIYEKVML